MSQPKWGNILGCHDRVFDLRLHLEICRWHDICPSYVIYTGSNPIDDVGVPVRKLKPIYASNQNVGQVLIESISWAAELGLTRMRFTNADDLVLSKTWVQQNFERPEQITAYNWFSINTMRDFAINENYMDVAFWANTLDIGRKSFRLRNLNVERAWADWINKVKPTLWRWAERERYYGVGTRFGDEIRDNKRYFNREVGLLGFHTLEEKYAHYMLLCEEPYMRDIEILEAMPFFNYWLDHYSK